MASAQPDQFVYSDEISSTKENSDNAPLFTFADGGGRVVIQPGRQEWFRILKGRLGELLALRAGWDGYQAKPIGLETAFFVAKILETLYVDELQAPSLVPGSDGSVQIEWHVSDWEIELLVKGPYKIEAYRCNDELEIEDEDEATTDYTVLYGWLRELALDVAQG